MSASATTQARFISWLMVDIRSGAARSAPITEAVRSFPVRVVAGRVEVEVVEQGSGAGNAAGGCGGTCATAAPAVQLPASRTLSVRIASIDKAGTDVAVLRLHQDSGAPLAYLPGQYLDVLLDGGVRRSYSMATMGGGDTLELHIRHLPGGRFTDHVFGALLGGVLLKWLPLRSALARGALFGVGAHGAGVSRAHEVGGEEGAGILVKHCSPVRPVLMRQCSKPRRPASEHPRASA